MRRFTVTTNEGGSGCTDGAEDNYPILLEIARKCEPYITRYGINKDTDEPALLWLLVEEGPYGTDIPYGRRAQMALAAPFEQYKKFTLKDHHAIFSPTLGAVECEVEPCEASGRWSSASSRQKDRTARRILSALGLRSNPAAEYDLGQGRLDPDTFEDKRSYLNARADRIFKRSEAWEKDLEQRELDPSMRVTLETDVEASVSVGPCSDTWKVWQGSMDEPSEDGDLSRVRRYLTLRVEGVEVPDEESAADVLEHLGNAALFELERVSGVGLMLNRPWRDSAEIHVK